jgi:acyl carrier protein
VRGLITLSKVVEGDRNLDFWFLISSLSSVLAGLGFASYAASNLYLDAFAAYKNQAGSTWFSINWDNWQPAPTVPIKQSEDDAEPLLYLPDPVIFSNEGVETFRRMISSTKWKQLAVSTTDLKSRLDGWIGEGFDDDDRAVRSHARPELATEYVAPRSDLEKKISAVWCDFFGLERVGIHDNFFMDLGGQSLMAAQLVSRLRAVLRIEIPVRRLFECPTIAGLAAALNSLVAAQGNEGTTPEPASIAGESKGSHA